MSSHHWKILLLLPLFNVACATIDRGTPNNQALIVRSEPSGAQVHYKGQLLGETPALVTLPRDSSSHLTLSFPGQTEKDLRVIGKYRWKGSFLTNLLLLNLAPVGWITDIYTKNAYTLIEPETLKFKGVQKPVSQYEDKDWVIAIEPPVDEKDDVELVQDMGVQVQRILRSNFSDKKIISYKKSFTNFEKYAYSDGLRPKYDRAWRHNQAMYDLKATHVFKSVIDRSGEKVFLKGRLENVLTGEKITDLNVEVKKDDLRSVKQKLWLKDAGQFIHFIPNVIGFDFAKIQPRINFSGAAKDNITGKGVEGDNPWDKYFKYLGSINFNRIKAPSSTWDWKYTFQFIPTAFVSYQNVNYAELAAISQVNYERLIGGIGYGPQFGLNSKNGFIYFNFLLGMNWSEIHWVSPTDDGYTNKGSMNGIVELGYSYFITDRLNLRIFSRNVAESPDLWKQAFLDSTNQTLNIQEVGYFYAGLSLGYYLPDTDHPFKSLFSKD